MSKILVIGVGGAGRETVKHMKDIGIPEADYITFGVFEDDDERRDIRHYGTIHNFVFSILNNPMLFSSFTLRGSFLTTSL